MRSSVRAARRLLGPPPKPAVPARSEATASASNARFRPDIEGLRAIAIILVLLYHAGVGKVSGGFIGVDVFFVVSGFLITGLLLRELEQTGRVSLRRFYARRVRRLLPAATLVLVVTAVLAWRLGPVVDREVFGGDISAAALYVLNWRLADRSVDYLAEGSGISPVMHYWSLSVEEQFYLIWPLLLIAVGLLARRYPGHLRALLAGGLLLIVGPSFLWSLVDTADSPATAFFVTTTRLWELGHRSARRGRRCLRAPIASKAGLGPRLDRSAGHRGSGALDQRVDAMAGRSRVAADTGDGGAHHRRRVRSRSRLPGLAADAPGRRPLVLAVSLALADADGGGMGLGPLDAVARSRSGCRRSRPCLVVIHVPGEPGA